MHHVRSYTYVSKRGPFYRSHWYIIKYEWKPNCGAIDLGVGLKSLFYMYFVRLIGSASQSLILIVLLKSFTRLNCLTWMALRWFNYYQWFYTVNSLCSGIYAMTLTKLDMEHAIYQLHVLYFGCNWIVEYHIGWYFVLKRIFGWNS